MYYCSTCVHTVHWYTGNTQYTGSIVLVPLATSTDMQGHGDLAVWLNETLPAAKQYTALALAPRPADTGRNFVYRPLTHPATLAWWPVTLAWWPVRHCDMLHRHYSMLHWHFDLLHWHYSLLHWHCDLLHRQCSLLHWHCDFLYWYCDLLHWYHDLLRWHYNLLH